MAIDKNELFAWVGPHQPDIAHQAMPTSAFNDQIASLGMRFGWMRAHTCPCSYSNGTPGSPSPRCLTCLGRGVYWDTPPLDVLCHLTYMAKSTPPGEPGARTDEISGMVLQAEPTLSIPYEGPYNENTAWQLASAFDAWVEFDAQTRFNTTLVVSDLPASNVLPYQFGCQVLSVSAYDTNLNTIVPVPAGDWVFSNGTVSLVPSYSQGTAYTCEYLASPVYIAYRGFGGLPHSRPAAHNTIKPPRRFHLQLLDQWMRASRGGEAPVFGNTPR